MNKIKKILLLSCSLLALVSCGGGGTSSAPASVASSSQEASYPKYTFSGTHFYVVAEYSGDNVSYVAKAKTGNYEKITDLSEAREASALISNTVLVGCEYTYTGTFAFIDGKYSAATEGGGQHTVSAGVSANYTYNKTENKLVLADADLESSKAFYDKFTDVSKYQGVVSGTKLVAFSSLDDGASVTVAFPSFFYEDYEANPTSFTFDASYAVVVKNS